MICNEYDMRRDIQFLGWRRRGGGSWRMTRGGKLLAFGLGGQVG